MRWFRTHCRTRIPVWTLKQYRRLGMTETAMLEAFSTMRAADLANAWLYVQNHRAEIDEDIQQNESDDERRTDYAAANSV